MDCPVSSFYIIGVTLGVSDETPIISTPILDHDIIKIIILSECAI